MNIAQANKLVRAFIGEDDFHDVEDVLASYYDLAQTEIATSVAPIRKSITVDGGDIRLPDDLYRLISVSASYERTDRSHISTERGGEVEIKYFAYPQKLCEHSSPETEFEVDIAAHSAIPYFAAAQTVLSDSDMRRYYAFMDTYNGILSNLTASDREKGVMRIVKMEGMQ